MQQELQVLFAAVFEEVDDFFVLLHGSDDLGLFERARVVLVDPAREPAVGDETRRRRTSRAVAATRASWKLNDGRRART